MSKIRPKTLDFILYLGVAFVVSHFVILGVVIGIGLVGRASEFGIFLLSYEPLIWATCITFLLDGLLLFVGSFLIAYSTGTKSRIRREILNEEYCP